MKSTTLWDVAVVGAGPAGILATERLRAAGLRVLLLEAGKRERRRGVETPHDDPRWRFHSIGARAQWKRAHGVGGGTLLWGGWANRFADQAFHDGNWPYDAATLAPAYTEAERWLGVIEGVLDPRYVRAATTLGLPFHPRRGAKIGRKTWTARSCPAARTAQIETIAISLDLKGNRAHKLSTIDPTGRAQEIEAKAFVLAASPLETCRILFASGVKHPALGRGLVDHTNVGYLLVEPYSKILQGERGPFPGSAFIPRFMNLGDTPSRAYRGGFSIEIVGPWPLRSLGAAMLTNLGLSSQHGARHTFITALGELSPHPERYVELAPKARDAFGRLIPCIRFAWSDQERQMVAEMKQVCIAVAEAIASPGAELILCSDPFHSPFVFHPAGVCALGKTEAALCNPGGRLWTLENVFIADASVLPSAGDCHPTLTVLAHTIRMTEELLKNFNPTRYSYFPNALLTHNQEGLL
jgi:choline dehydrogenase-like flavoprotein